MKKLYYSNQNGQQEWIMHQFCQNDPGHQKPILIFVGGYMTDMHSTKASFLYDFCQQSKIDFIRFDYFGHGESSGELLEGDINIWSSNLEMIINQVPAERKILLIGSSLGGWISLLNCLKFPNRIIGFIGIAPAPDFTVDLMEEELSLTEKETLYKENVIYKPINEEFSMPFSKKLIESGEANLVLNKPINIDIPVILLHGLEDNIVKPNKSNKIAEKLTSSKVYTIFIKDGNHSLSREEDLKILSSFINNIIT